jgi:hypothetical protein
VRPAPPHQVYIRLLTHRIVRSGDRASSCWPTLRRSVPAPLTTNRASAVSLDEPLPDRRLVGFALVSVLPHRSCRASKTTDEKGEIRLDRPRHACWLARHRSVLPSSAMAVSLGVPSVCSYTRARTPNTTSGSRGGSSARRDLSFQRPCTEKERNISVNVTKSTNCPWQSLTMAALTNRHEDGDGAVAHDDANQPESAPRPCRRSSPERRGLDDCRARGVKDEEGVGMEKPSLADLDFGWSLY